MDKVVRISIYLATELRTKKHGHGYDHGDTTWRNTGTRQISKNQDTDMVRTRHIKIK